MTLDKELAARKAAAKVSTDPFRAIMKYVELTGQWNAGFSGDTFNELRDEMLSLCGYPRF